MSRGSASADGSDGDGIFADPGRDPGRQAGDGTRSGGCGGDVAPGGRPVPAGLSWDLVLSHAAAEPDAAWSRWLTWQLSAAGYRVLPHPLPEAPAPGPGATAPGSAGGPTPAGATVIDLEAHLAAGGEILVIWSSAYLAEVDRLAARGVASGEALHRTGGATGDPTRTGRVMLVRVEDCPRSGAYGRLLAFDLFGLDATTARDWLLRQVSVVAPRPAAALAPPPFPGGGGPESASVSQPGAGPADTATSGGGPPHAGPPVWLARPGDAGELGPAGNMLPARTPDRPVPAGHGAAGHGPPSATAVGQARRAAGDLGAARRLSVLREDRGHPMSVTFSPTGALVATGGTDTSVRLWALAFPEPPRLIATVGYGRRINQEWVRAVTFSPDGGMLAAAGDAGTTVLWDLTRPDRPVPVMTLTGHRGYLHDLGFSPGGTLLATAGDDRAVLLWDLAEPGVPRRAASLSGHRGPVRAVTFSPDGTLLATGAEDKTVILWDLAEPTRPAATATVSGARGPIHTLAFSPDGDLIAVAGKDRALRVYSVADPTGPTVLAETTDHRRAVHAVAFSPDGTLLAAGSGDRTATVRDITDPEHPGEAHRLPPHGAPVHDVSFAADSRLLATASGDRTTVLWDLFPGN